MVTIPQFPVFTGRTWHTKKTPEVQTTRMQAYSGRRFAQPNWPYPIYHYEFDLAFLRSSGTYQEMQTFEGFWKAVLTTPGQLFIYLDPDDGSITNQYIGTGDGSRTLWQAMRTRGGFIEPVTAVLDNEVEVTSFIDDGLVSDTVGTTVDDGLVSDAVGTIIDDGLLSDTHFYVDGVEVDATIFAGGSLQFTIAPTNGADITWTGSFGWLCQPDEDTAEFDVLLPQIYELQQFTFTTARPNA